MSNSSAVTANAATATQLTWLQRQCRRGLLSKLGGLDGTLVIDESGVTTRLGSGVGSSARILVRDPAFFVDVATRGSLGAATSWMDGSWDSDDLTDVFALLRSTPSSRIRSIEDGRG